jgi:hypothetical protein
MDLVIPKWLDEVKGVDFSPEKEMLTELESWAYSDGWEVSDGRNLDSELRGRTDVLLERPNERRYMRIAVLPKVSRSPGMIRIDASTHRVFELIYQPKAKRWRVETAAVPLSDDVRASGWNWLTNLAFRP